MTNPNDILLLINNNITETYCSLEVSKKLKNLFFESSESVQMFDSSGNSFYKKDYKFWSAKYVNSIERPTHSIAFNWIAENFGFWIYIERDMDGNCFPKINITSEKVWKHEDLRIIKFDTNKKIISNTYFYKSYEVAANETILILLEKIELVANYGLA